MQHCKSQFEIFCLDLANSMQFSITLDSICPSLENKSFKYAIAVTGPNAQYYNMGVFWDFHNFHSLFSTLNEIDIS